MKEHPILFSAPMILALLAGTKTQTRRIIKPVDVVKICGITGELRHDRHNGSLDWAEAFLNHEPVTYGYPDGKEKLVSELPSVSPFGTPSDRLWVRETCRAEELPDGTNGVRYLADSHFQPINNTAEAGKEWVKLYHYGKRRGATVPPIHAPRWTSRLLLEKVAGRVEQLQSISEADARAEGVGRDDGGEYGIAYKDYLNQNGGFRKATESFRTLWASIHGLGSWEANPWLWVEEFKRIQQ
jgi:hypothetical protein